MRATSPDVGARLSVGHPRPSGALSASSLLQLRRVIAMHRERPLPSDALAGVALGVAADAWATGLAAEQMLVALKAAWLLAEPTRQLPPQVARALFDRLVTQSIRAYYGVDGGSRRGLR